jgi:hypothetical protein
VQLSVRDIMDTASMSAYSTEVKENKKEERGSGTIHSETRQK